MTRIHATSKFHPKAWIFPGLLVLCLIVGAHGASAEDIKSRINRLENEMQTLSRAVFKGETPPPGAFSGGGADAADTEVRLQQLETQIRELTGKIEEQNFQLSQLQEQLQRLEQNNQASASAPSYAGSPQPQPQAYPGNAPVQSSGYYDQPVTGSNPPQPQAQPQNAMDSAYTWNSRNGAESGQASLGTINSNPAAGDAGATLYENAFAALKNGQYDQAEAGFNDFLGQYPGHALTGNAKYWLGESYYARGQYDKASRTFAEAYQDAPKGAKAADNLLKLGMALASQGKKDDACIALGQVEKEFAAGAGPVLRRAQEEMTKVGC